MSDQAPLFDAGPAGTAVVRVGIVGSQKALSRAQKAFNRWTARIEKQRAELVGWRDRQTSVQQRVGEELLPLHRELLALRLAILRRFDAACESGDLGRREQTRLGRLIVDGALSLLEDGAEPDAALEALHDRYSAVSLEALREQETQALRAGLEEVSGADFAPDGDHTDAWADPLRAARSQARVAREQRLAEGATRSLRETWRRLASQLHPDREPDPVERERKTALMQRANQAYEARDLMQLLALQQEASQVDPASLAGLHDERIEAYNRLLREQSEALADEIAGLKAGLQVSREDSTATLTPARVLSALDQEIAMARRDRQGLKQDLERFRDVLWIKAWLKAVPASRRRRDD